jgi:hypothetical protein
LARDWIVMMELARPDPEHMANRGGKLIRLEGFQQQRLRADAMGALEARRAGDVRSAAGNREDVELWAGVLQCLDQLDAVALGHQDVSDHDVHRVSAYLVERLSTTARTKYAMALRLEP